MATGKKNRGAPERVVRRPKEERKRLPPELEAFARSDERRLRTGGPRTPKLKDPRPVALVPGVSNRDARAVFDARLEALRKLVVAGPSEALDEALAETVILGLWRGRAVTGFNALIENLLSSPAEEARASAKVGAERLGVICEPGRPELVAAWFRAEAAILEEGYEARVGVRGDPSGAPELVLTVAGNRAAEAFHAVGRRMTPLVRDHQEGGLPPPSR